jgi:hypothetical protein
VLLGRNITTPDALRSFHRRFTDAGPQVSRVTVGTELVAALAVGWYLSPMVGIGATGAVAVAGAVAGIILMRRRAMATSDDSGAPPRGAEPAKSGNLESVTVR